jgi:uncharacterized protein (TIGR03435 family)
MNICRKSVFCGIILAAIIVPIEFSFVHAAAPGTRAPAALVQQFDVASIKPCMGDAPSAGGGGASGNGTSVSPGRFTARCQTVKSLVAMAYVLYQDGRRQGASSLRILPVEGGPGWINSERYTINAETEENAKQEVMGGPMLKALLEDRFKLKMHRETREVPVYEMIEVKSGFKLRPAAAESCVVVDFANLEKVIPGTGEKPYCGQAIVKLKGPNWTVDIHGMSLDEFAKWLDGGMDRLVFNKTGISGRYDFHLEFAPDESTPGFHAMPARGDGGDESIGASIFTVLQQQFGLKLAPAKGPGSFLVIDSVERPSAN